MEKINFKNKGEPGAIPANADNLNLMQNNIENSFKSNKTTSDKDTYNCNYINGIIESESNSNGNWIKFADGTLITVHQVNQTLSRSSAWGNMYETDQAASLGNYPQEFKYTPYIFLTLYGTNALFEAVNDTTKTSAGKVYLIAPTANAGQNYTIQVLAVGRWK